MAVQWSLVFFAALAAWGAGTYTVATVLCSWLDVARRAQKPAVVLSIAAVVVGGIASMTHLGHVDRVFGVLSNPTSGIFIEGLSVGLLVVVSLVFLIASSRNASKTALKVIATIGILPAVVLAVAIGASYLMPSIPAWNTPGLPLLSVATAAALGGATVMALAGILPSDQARERDVKVTSRVALACIAAEAASLVIYVACVGMAPYQDYSRSVERIAAGDVALLFWGVVVLIGIVVPFIASLLHAKKPSSVMAGAAALCAVIGAVGFRVMMFLLGSTIISFGF